MRRAVGRVALGTRAGGPDAGRLGQRRHHRAAGPSPWLRLVCQLCARAARPARLGFAAARTRRTARVRSADPARRLRRIRGPARRWPGAEPGRSLPATDAGWLRGSQCPLPNQPGHRVARACGLCAGRAAPACGRCGRRHSVAPVQQPGARGSGAASNRRPAFPLCRRARRTGPRMASGRSLDPGRSHPPIGRTRGLRPVGARGLWGHGDGQGGGVRRDRAALARPHRARLARNAIGDRSRTDPLRRHRRAEGAPAPRHRCRHPDPNCGLHRAGRRIRSECHQDARGSRRRDLPHPRQQDLDDPRRAQRPDDAAGPHRSSPARLPRPVDVSGGETARQRRQPVPGRRHERQRDCGAGLPWHEGVRSCIRRLRSAGIGAARRRRGPRLQAADADL